ncbi:aminotransferase class I/II-fold pyridoxal phosphate-dependent enzyme [Pseudonocardia spinosispora]|uniref:aminotransferase class I/II-fold pyridoxal phosphate-dependent enzyme n=1 Tax=Pseudonocardia spinosispora TaxID=103441 RepID=UPI000408AFF9|nr:aminotransferase class I/II-fold pyridoxal phosphate-dependent enzyme [Pseudonocardia spinosispora]
MSGTEQQRLSNLAAGELAQERDRLAAEHTELVGKGLSLNLTRGKPSTAQLDLANGLLELPGPGGGVGADGTDYRNYGGLQGLAGLRELFSPIFGIPVPQLIAEGNSSLALMYQCVVDGLLHGVPGGSGPWRDVERPAFIAAVPGYDRHFAVCQELGIDLITVPMTENGPDVDAVRAAAADPRVKGMWCVPTYSNPTGVTYSAEVVEALASMPTGAPDFRLFWDNAYAVHHLTDFETPSADILAITAAAGNPDRAFVFGSTSKITAAGAGVAFFGSSEANVAWYLQHMQFRTIGPDKVNQSRHLRFLGDVDGLRSHMAAHRALIAPKFELVDQVLREDLSGVAVAEWVSPKGGYFISLDVLEGCASRVVELAKQAGIALTPAGATFPYGKDPADRNIRIAPTFPELDELDVAVRGLTLCVRLAEAERRSA